MRVTHMQCVGVESTGVAGELLYIGVIVSPASLSLASKDILKGVLAYPLAKEGFNLWLCEQVPYRFHK